MAHCTHFRMRLQCFICNQQDKIMFLKGNSIIRTMLNKAKVTNLNLISLSCVDMSKKKKNPRQDNHLPDFAPILVSIYNNLGDVIFS